VCKAVGVVFSVGGGLCVGKEGPLVHTGSVLGANISHGLDICTARFKKWNRFRNDSLKRDFVSGGCAAGVAAAFGAPMVSKTRRFHCGSRGKWRCAVAGRGSVCI
jgi:H+/Cl- antiporter ClcA